MIIKKNAGKKAEDIVVENPVEKEPEVKVEEEKIDLFNLDNIDFKQRQERRRGDRRRGFRRIDDRNLISRAREEAQSIKEAAAKEGYQEGLEQAKADILDVKNAITAFLGAKQAVFDYIAPDIFEISVEIAQKIIKKELHFQKSCGYYKQRRFYSTFTFDLVLRSRGAWRRKNAIYTRYNVRFIPIVAC